MPISLDDQFQLVERQIQRNRKFMAEKGKSYSSNYIATIARDNEVWEAVKETVRQARQNQQMTGMTGKRIE